MAKIREDINQKEESALRAGCKPASTVTQSNVENCVDKSHLAPWHDLWLMYGARGALLKPTFYLARSTPTIGI